MQQQIDNYLIRNKQEKNSANPIPWKPNKMTNINASSFINSKLQTDNNNNNNNINKRPLSTNNNQQSSKLFALDVGVAGTSGYSNMVNSKKNITSIRVADVTASSSSSSSSSLALTKWSNQKKIERDNVFRSVDSKLRIVSGGVEKILKYRELTINMDVLFELYSDVMSIRKGKQEFENILLLRNNSSGPVIQAIYYEIDSKFPLISPGDSVRCVGRFIGNSRFNIMKITKILVPDNEFVKRLENIGTYILNKENKIITSDF